MALSCPDPGSTLVTVLILKKCIMFSKLTTAQRQWRGSVLRWVWESRDVGWQLPRFKISPYTQPRPRAAAPPVLVLTWVELSSDDKVVVQANSEYPQWIPMVKIFFTKLCSFHEKCSVWKHRSSLLNCLFIRNQQNLGFNLKFYL